MANGIRRYADLAGTFLLWIEEVADDPPWLGHVFRRPWKVPVPIETPRSPLVILYATQHWYQNFPARTEAIALEGVVLTVRNCFPEYAHRIGEVHWKDYDLTEEQWEADRKRFMRPRGK